jgi:hypothetical protein
MTASSETRNEGTQTTQQPNKVYQPAKSAHPSAERNEVNQASSKATNQQTTNEPSQQPP